MLTPGAGPEGDAVVAALVGVGPLRAVARPPGVDDPGVAGLDRVGVDAEPVAGRGEEVGEEDVGAFAQRQQQLPPVVGGDVDADAALPPVEHLPEVGDAALAGLHAVGDEAPERDRRTRGARP